LEEAHAMNLSTEEDALARGWFGFGSWSAPYWFVGMEPGGDHGDWPRMWLEQGSPEMVDCVAHCRDVSPLPWSWHGDRIQPTWRGLLIAKLAFDGSPYDRESVRTATKTYCATDSDTASIELSALAARSLAVERPRTRYRTERVALIRTRMMQNHPRFAIFYGLGYRADYEAIAGPFDNDGFAWQGDTLCAIAAHPSRKRETAYWADLGRELGRRLPPRKL
jgi:hypothetical protein